MRKFITKKILSKLISTIQDDTPKKYPAIDLMHLLFLLDANIDQFEFRKNKPNKKISNIYKNVELNLENCNFNIHHGFLSYIESLEKKYEILNLIKIDENKITINDFSLLIEKECF